MAIDVTVKTKCDRCARESDKVISSDAVSAFELELKAKSSGVTALENLAAELKSEGKLPDLVVIHRGKVQVQGTVCTAHCDKPVANNLELIFREPKARKPRSKKVKLEAEVAVREVPVETTKVSNTPHKPQHNERRG